MRAPLLASASIAVFLIGCVPAPSTDTTWKEGAVPGLVFEYPESWGEMMINADRTPDTAIQVRTFKTLHDSVQYPNGGKKNVEFFMRAYDMEENRYEEVCESVVDLCDTTVQSDMYEQKSEHEKAATTTVAGYPATFSDRYDPSGGGVMRSWKLFTDKDRIDIHTWFDISSLYMDEYDRRVDAGQSPSISALVAEDIGENYEDPTAKLIALYPEQTTELQAFLADVTHMIDSMKPTKH